MTGGARAGGLPAAARFAASAAAALLAGVVLGVGLLATERTTGPVTVENHRALISAGSTGELVDAADVVVRARYLGVRENAAIDRPAPGDEGYLPGDPADIYAALRFRSTEVVKGDVAVGAAFEVLVPSGLGDDLRSTPRMRVYDETTGHFQRTDGTFRDARQAGGRSYLLFLQAPPVSAGAGGTYRPIGWGFAELGADGALRFPGHRTPLVSGTAVTLPGVRTAVRTQERIRAATRADR